MKPIFSESYFLSAGEVNAEGEMSLPLLVTRLIDIATAHANSLGIGNPSLAEYNAGWVLSRLTIEMQSYPVANKEYRISTWIESINRHFSERAFKIESPDGDIYGYAKSVWMVMDTVNRSNLGLSHISLPSEAIAGTSVPIVRQARHIRIIEHSVDEESSKEWLVATAPPFQYRFKYCDLDFYRHVNTVRYVVLLLNRFSLEEHDTHMVRRLELSFLHEARYGMETTLLRSDCPEQSLSSFQLSDNTDGTPLLFARLFRQPRQNTLEK